MKIVQPSAKIIAASMDLMSILERAGRVCYKSEDRITPDSADAFVLRMLDSKHESVIEHGSITVEFVCDRGVSHELVRHRLASFSQESTRYCNYGKGKFGEEITVIDIATGFNYNLENHQDRQRYKVWKAAMEFAEQYYLQLLEQGATPQEARSVLPNSLKTEVIMTANPREWRHVFKLRTSNQAHPQMRQLMIPLLANFIERWPALFESL